MDSTTPLATPSNDDAPSSPLAVATNRDVVDMDDAHDGHDCPKTPERHLMNSIRMTPDKVSRQTCASGVHPTVNQVSDDDDDSDSGDMVSQGESAESEEGRAGPRTDVSIESDPPPPLDAVRPGICDGLGGYYCPHCRLRTMLPYHLCDPDRSDSDFEMSPDGGIATEATTEIMVQDSPHQFETDLPIPHHDNDDDGEIHNDDDNGEIGFGDR